jgi:hypothetical protein
MAFVRLDRRIYEVLTSIQYLKIIRMGPIMAALILILLPTGQVSFMTGPTPCSLKDEDRFAFNLSLDLFVPLEITDERCRLDTLSHDAMDSDWAKVVDKAPPLHLTPTSRISFYPAQDTLIKFSPQKQIRHTGLSPLYLQNSSLLF